MCQHNRQYEQAVLFSYVVLAASISFRLGIAIKNSNAMQYIQPFVSNMETVYSVSKSWNVLLCFTGGGSDSSAAASGMNAVLMHV